MTEKRFHTIPDFILRDLSASGPLPEKDLEGIEKILEETAQFKYPDAGTGLAWQSFAARLEPAMTVSKKPLVSRQFAMFRWAAAAVVILTAGIAFWQFSISKQDTFAASYKTNLNKQTIQLKDGSTIELNTNTILEVKSMNETERILCLKSGEAFFKVTHNDLPFIVETEKGNIRVMGTEFDVKVKSKGSFSIFLKSGKIEFAYDNKTFIMSPGDLLTENPGGGFEVAQVSDNRQYAWLDNKIVFDNTTLSKIIQGLESYYQVKFKYDKTLDSEKYNLTFDNLTAVQAADVLTKALNSKVTIE